jgi:acyl-CoA synthetase (AMP-forming)/AMP-acid ligase II
VPVFAIATHAAVLSATGVACVYLLNYLQRSAQPATSLYVLMPFLPSHGLLPHLTALIDLFDLWWLIVFALGLSALYHRRPHRLVLTGIGLYLLAALARAAVKVFAGAPV